MTRRSADSETPGGAAPPGEAPTAGPGAAGFIVRANPRYELVLLDHLEAREREALLHGAEEADLYGVLRPLPPAALPPVAVSCETALLFTSLRQPGPLPHFARRRLGDDADASLLPLLADGVLELRQDGAFVSGPAALAHLEITRAAGPRSRCAALSWEALQRAAAMRGASAARLTEYLYRYNTRPLTPALRRTHPDAGAVAGWLDVRALGERLTPRGFHVSGNAAWHVWARRGGTRHGQTCKLYVSAGIEGLPEVLRATLDVASSAGAFEVKVGRTLEQLLRPDKLVVYFDDVAALQAAATRLRPRVTGVAAHGVPFTAPIDAAGVLSWGMDPPEHHAWTSSGGSFRLWMAERLAAAIATAHADGDGNRDGNADDGSNGDDGGSAAATFAVQRLQLDGVDTTTWTPSQRLFSPAAGSAS